MQGSAKAKNQRCMLSLSATKQAISIRLATTVSLIFNVTLTLTLQTFIWHIQLLNDYIDSLS